MLLLATILLTAFINNSIAVYGQNITNSNNNISQNQNQRQNNPNPATTTNTPDKSEKEIKNVKWIFIKRVDCSRGKGRMTS